MKRAIAIFMLVLAGLADSVGQSFKELSGPTPITISAQALDGFDRADRSRRQFGELRFRGGIVLSSSHKAFGGLSGFRIQEDGSTFIALSDRGVWLRGRIVYQKGRPAGITDAVIEPVLTTAGRPAFNWDTESIAQDGKKLYVGVEDIDSIMTYEYNADAPLSRARKMAIRKGLIALPRNRGLEALVFVPRNLPHGGSLIAFSERGLDNAGNLKAFLIGEGVTGTFSVKRSDDYDISDAAILPSGEVLILERRFTLTGLASTRIRRIRLDRIRPGTVVDGPVIFEADMRYQIDNMECIDVHRSASGELIVTLVSDDNYAVIQRTLLLQFTLAATDSLDK